MSRRSTRSTRRSTTGAPSGQKYDRNALDEFLSSLAQSQVKYEPQPTINARIARRELIDQHIAELENVLGEVTGALNKTINALYTQRMPNFVNLLDDEILVRIFKYAGEQGADVGTTMTITHTSSRWRKLAMRTPTLWTVIDMVSMRPPLIEHYENLSATQTLDIQVPIGRTIPQVKQGRILPRVKRLSLRRGTFDNLLKNSMSWLYLGSAPELQSLSLRCGASGDPNTWRQMLDWEISHAFSISVLSMGHPKLRELELIGVRFEWVPGKYQGLTHLTISVGQSFPEKKENVLHIFRESPNLQELVLNSLDELPIAPLGATDTLIPMRSLRKLTLSLYSRDIYAILSSIATTPNLQLTLRCIIVRGAQPQAQYLQLPKDARCLPCLELIEKLSFDAPGNAITAFAPGAQQPLLSATFITDQELVVERAVALSFSAMRGLPLLSLRALSIREQPTQPFRSEDIGMFFWDTARDVEGLTLTGSTAEAFCKIALHYKDQIRPYCAKLRSLRVTGMSIAGSALLTACSVLARADRTLTLHKVTLDPGAPTAIGSQPPQESAQAAAAVVEKLRRLKYARVTITDASWGVRRTPL
ncbi:hypothetical protein EIP86_007945 [Pleurotus ostreatoroseus]|nr:hypothetical protein EIP86_007945 [Pleurotus ostreatoroseus]